MTLRRPLSESILLFVTVLIVAVVLETSGVARTLASMVLVFVLPGRAFLAAWFPKRLEDAPGNLLLTLMLSIAIAVIGGLLLNLLPQGLQTQTWALWLGGSTIFNGIVALILSVRHAETAHPRQALALRPGQVLMILVAGVLVMGSIVVARNGAFNQARPGFTQLWIVKSGTPNQVQIGVQNEEGSSVSYWLVVRQGTIPLQAYYDMHIDAAGTWNAIVQLPADAASAGQPIEADLYRADQPDRVYRNVSLWLPEAN
jgi:uncharacterized membrane protein